MSRRLTLRPAMPRPSSIAATRCSCSRDEEALASFDKALTARPDLIDAHYNRATLLKSMKRFDEALAGYEVALALGPDHPEAFGAAEAALAICDWARVGRVADGLAAAIAVGKASVTPFA